MFLNYSNHPSDKWSQEQIAAAQRYGEIADCPFPAVPSAATAEEIARLAQTECARILELLQARGDKENAVLCQGEFTLCFGVITLLKSHGVTVVAAVTERVAKETTRADGTAEKISVFQFMGFREYL